MERVMAFEELSILQHANHVILEFLGRYAGRPVQGTQQEVRALCEIEATVRSVGAILHAGQPSAMPQPVSAELTMYRENLTRLHNELACLQISASERLNGCEGRRDHLNGLQLWYRALRGAN